MQIQHGNVCRPSEKRQPDRDLENEVRGSGVGAGYIVEEAMAKTQYDNDVTALLVIDPYNDFIPKVARSGRASKLLRKPIAPSPICMKF
jgi:hypothetical protein